MNSARSALRYDSTVIMRIIGPVRAQRHAIIMHFRVARAMIDLDDARCRREFRSIGNALTDALSGCEDAHGSRLPRMTVRPLADRSLARTGRPSSALSGPAARQPRARRAAKVCFLGAGAVASAGTIGALAMMVPMPPP